MKKPIVRVTDHAVLRYLERVKGVDVEALRAEIGRTVDLALEHPGANGVCHGGFVYRLQRATVVTITPQHQPDIHTGGPGRKGCRNE